MEEEEASIRRSSRSRKAPGVNSKVHDALMKMKDARNRGAVYRENVENLVEDVYTEVSEAEYEKIVQERRKEGADFMVDDGNF